MEQSKHFTGLSTSNENLPSECRFVLISSDGEVEAVAGDHTSPFDKATVSALIQSIIPDLCGGADEQDYVATPISRNLRDGKKIYTMHCAPFADGRWVLTILPNQPANQSTQKKVNTSPHEDALTGLLTRAALNNCVESLERERSFGNEVFCLYVDLDRFKQINDTLGHGAGDLLLRKVSKRILGCVRETDAVMRLGGDEFLVLGHTENAQSTASEIGARIVNHVSRPYLLAGNQAVIGASVGISFLEPEDDIDAVLKKADLALYNSKRNGRGCVSSYDSSMESEAELRRAMDIKLRQALVLGSFEVFFQPQFHLPDNRIAGFEALLRLREDDGSLVDAAAFLELAEETRLIGKIGKLVMEEAIKAASQWPNDVSISINVSQVELRHGEIAEDLGHLLVTHVVDAERVQLEVRESVLASGCDVTLKKIIALKELGVRLAVDKLGDDDSALSGLFENWVDCVKLNKSKLTSYSGEQSSQKLPALVSLSKAAGARVVADSVETAEQLRAAKEFGCDIAQGYVFQRAVPFHETLALFDRRMIPSSE